MQETLTSLLNKIRAGSSAAESQLFALFLPKFHRRASKAMAGERRGHTLTPTALVHEFWHRCMNGKILRRISGQDHLLRKASQIMQQVLVDHARTKKAWKRGGDWDRVPLATMSDPRAELGWKTLIVREAVDDLGAVGRTTGPDREASLFQEFHA